MDPLRAVFYHLVLPTQIPGEQDSDLELVSCDVLGRMIRACKSAGSMVDLAWSNSFRSVQASLETCLALNTGQLDSAALLKYFRDLLPNQMLILHVVEQNAALLIRREKVDGDDVVVFESFEASPASEDVLAAGEALRWDFPGRCARVPFAEFHDEQFQQCLAGFLEQASMESIYNLQASADKAKVSVTEIRDTTDPALVTQMLMPLLEAMGTHHQPFILRKRVRDDVNFHKAEIPWRRLPLWLIIRVATQRQLYMALGNKEGRIGYKALMCFLFAELLKDATGKLNPATVMTLRAKLCRRMAKLEMEKGTTESIQAQSLLSRMSPVIKDIVQGTAQVENAWKAFKRQTTRQVAKLPSRAPDHALRLSLPNSGPYLDRLLRNQLERRDGISSFSLPQPLDKAIKETSDFTDHIFHLADTEESAGNDEQTNHTIREYEDHCIQLAHRIEAALAGVGTTYDGNPEQMSALILTLFTLWVQLDQAALVACPILRDHQPVFTPQLLDVLQIPTLVGMGHLRDIQEYLSRRVSESQYGNVFDRLDDECFAARYVARSQEMNSLRARIQNASDIAYDAKEREWKRTRAEFDRHTQGISENTCRCTWDQGKRDVRGCTKCWHLRSRKRLSIQVQEAYLPARDPERAVLVFELAIPQYLAAYRDATWRIHELAYPSRPKASLAPEMKLSDSGPLKPYRVANIQRVSLASTVKCFSQTHYKLNTANVPLSRILLPLAARFELYDHGSKSWVREYERPLTFQHICGVHIPRGLRDTVLPAVEHPPPVLDGPSSYQIQANQTECPSRLSIHEFSAHQKLLGGTARRWPNMLVEMGSSNLNLSNEDTARALLQLAIQAGPSLPGDTLREVHVVFKEPAFVERLLEVIEKRLLAIQTNWREHNYMELLIALTLRALELSSGITKDRTQGLLQSAREATLVWTSSLRREFLAAPDAGAAQRIAQYGFYASLLCRRTFQFYVGRHLAINARDLTVWVQASVALQENALGDIQKLPQAAKNMLVRDLKMAYHLQPLLKVAIRLYPQSVSDGISRTWSDTSGNSGTALSQLTFLPEPHGRWIAAFASNRYEASRYIQLVHFNFVEGHLLVDHKRRGKLPRDIQDSAAIKELFGNQHLLTYPSSLPGMTHRLSISMKGQEVHFGMRDGEVVVRALAETGLLEFVPRDKFKGIPGVFDLPAELTDKCAHWVNINTRCLEVRRAPGYWIKRQRDWEIDIPGRVATRANVNLVDPQSDISSKVAQIFRHFERPEMLTVYQPQAYRGRLMVELRHMGLRFSVEDGMLECQQLNAQIDTDQDAGTWYGLQSKIVLRDITSGKRMIIIPLGEPEYKRHGMHVEVKISGKPQYGRYKIDDVLGRLSCPPEPVLVYTKALCHALTSFCIPDPLTCRTGTEEAFSVLRSGAAQPWIPLEGLAPSILQHIASLAPQREYYPPNLRRLQKVIWDDNLTSTIQHDGYESIVRDILRKSNDLNHFAAKKMDYFRLSEITHLRHRGDLRRQLYERVTHDTADHVTFDDVYIPRDRIATSKAHHVHEIARLVLTGATSLHFGSKLVTLLESSPAIGGFSGDGNLAIGEPLVSQIEASVYESWGDLVQFCRFADHDAPLLFRLGLLAFHSSPNMDLIRSFVAIASWDRLYSISPPPYPGFIDFKTRGRPTAKVLEALIAPSYPEFHARFRRRNVLLDLARRDSEEHTELCKEEGQMLANHFRDQWPASPDELSLWMPDTEVVDASLALDKITPEWERRRQNSELKCFLDQVQGVLDAHIPTEDVSRLYQWVDMDPTFIGGNQVQVIPSIAHDLVTKDGPGLKNPVASNSARDDNIQVPLAPTKAVIHESKELETILSKFASSSNELRTRYGNDLIESLTALKNVNEPSTQSREMPLKDVSLAVEHARQTVTTYHKDISAALVVGDNRSSWLELGNLWPCVSTVEVLSLLKSTMAYKFGVRMKEVLVHYGLALTTLQRMERLRQAMLRKDRKAQNEELRNPGHSNWSALEYPDWLLLEIDGDFLIRVEQVEVAQAMIAPRSAQNSVLQMNMGQGKTSCIVPMVIAALADGQNLARLVVPKALLMQTAEMAQSRLGGLVGRAIIHVPFSRKTEHTPEILDLYGDLHRMARNKRDLVLTSHENILSYKLGGWQRLADGEIDAADSMTNFQNWLDEHCRDILDECDFTLAVKTQLNYPSGTEMAVDGHPHRWHVAQGLLSLVGDYVPALRKRFPSGIEVLERSGSFPIVQLLSEEVEDAVHEHLLDNICSGQAPFLRPADLASFLSRHHALRQILSGQKFDQGQFAGIVNTFVNPQSASSIILTVRGLIMHRILLLCLNKRWNVQYGLHPNRHPVAVPFEAKGTPSEQSEFGHPDVAITFTCLAFYYTGLALEQLRQGLQQILQSDDPATQYEWWTSGCPNLPEALRHWNVINVEDGGQMELLWKRLRSDRVVINHYLNHFVFPLHAKQFSIKLQASAWDLPLYAQEEHRGARTTGFSGTNDNRTMLPLTIRQDDLHSLRQTSAEVLSYLLQPRNRAYKVTVDFKSKRLSEIGLLYMLEREELWVLIDAGAYILEMDSQTLAREWLKVNHKAKAAVYFRNDNRAWVHYRGELQEDIPLLATPFVDDLSECVVYLDEAHTRGVDLKLPANAHGALTLALKQTKDYTMQAAMRLRQLSTTQSVTFFAPPEVDQSIRDFCGPANNELIDSSHVVSWLLEQTCRVNEDLQSLYVAQGTDFCRRTDAIWQHKEFLADAQQRADLLKVLQQPERQTLEQLYGNAADDSKESFTNCMAATQLQRFVEQLNRAGGDNGVIQGSAMEEVEQEREVQVQVEQVRQVQKPWRYGALTFPGLHTKISDFARTGVLLDAPSANEEHPVVEQAFSYIARTSIGRRFNVCRTDSRLFISREFGQTVKTRLGNTSIADNFLRPIEWILWCPSTQTALVIVPEEAELLIPKLRLAGRTSPVHLIGYAAPVTKAMLDFNKFRYYSLPALPPEHKFPEWFRFELGVLGGRLYVDLAEWDRLSYYLRPPSKTMNGNVEGMVGMQRNEEAPASFTRTPASFLLEWLTLRRKTQDVSQTPIGYICTGRPLGENHSFRQSLS